MRVLATDQRFEKPTDDGGKTVISAASNVTLEATPKLSEKIAVAQTIGTLSLSLRSIADDRMELEREIAAGELSVPADPRAEKQMLLQVASRPSDGDTTFSTGGDVSRFQRRTVPPAPAATALSPVSSAPPLAGGAAPYRRPGPVVVIARGNTVTEIPVGSN